MGEVERDGDTGGIDSIYFYEGPGIWYPGVDGEHFSLFLRMVCCSCFHSTSSTA